MLIRIRNLNHYPPYITIFVGLNPYDMSINSWPLPSDHNHMALIFIQFNCMERMCYTTKIYLLKGYLSIYSFTHKCIRENINNYSGKIFFFLFHLYCNIFITPVTLYGKTVILDILETSEYVKKKFILATFSCLFVDLIRFVQ